MLDAGATVLQNFVRIDSVDAEIQKALKRFPVFASHVMVIYTGLHCTTCPRQWHFMHVRHGSPGAHAHVTAQAQAHESHQLNSPFDGHILLVDVAQRSSVSKDQRVDHSTFG